MENEAPIHLLYDPDSADSKIHKKLRDLEAILRRWNKNMNLVSQSNEPLIWTRHIVDSLQMVPHVREANKVADMGSGIGFPCIPLAIACPDVNFFSIEPNQKKSALTTQLISELGLPNVHVLPERVEKVVISHVDVVCCRAFGEFLRDAQLAYKMLRPGGLFVTFKSFPEDRVPKGFDKISNHPYRIPQQNKDYYLVVAQKFSDFD